MTRLWAGPAYRMVYDPDGRGYRDRSAWPPVSRVVKSMLNQPR